MLHTIYFRDGDAWAWYVMRGISEILGRGQRRTKVNARMDAAIFSARFLRKHQ